MTTPVAGPPTARRLRSSPGDPRRARSPRTTWTSASPTIASSSIAAYALGPEQEQRAEQVVEPPLRARDDEDPAGADAHGLVEGELEVGGVLRLRVAHDAGACRLGSGERVRVDTESRSPITTSTSSPSAVGAVEPAVRRDDGRRAGHGDRGAGPRGDDDDVRFGHARSSAGITQVRFCGSAARQPPSQPGCPSSPVRSPYRSRADGPGDGRHVRARRLLGARLRRPAARLAGDPEAALAARLPLLDVEPLDPRAGRPVSEPRDEHLDVLGVSFQLRLDGPVRSVPHPAADAELRRRAGARSRGTTRPGRGRGRRRCGGRAAPRPSIAAAWHGRGVDARRRACDTPGSGARSTSTPRGRGRSSSAPASRRTSSARSEAPILLVGEAPGYRGARVSGLPFTSERQLTATGRPRRRRRSSSALSPSSGSTTTCCSGTSSRRIPARRRAIARRPEREVRERARVRGAPRGGRRVIAVGRVAAGALEAAYVRHPSHGGRRASSARGLRAGSSRGPVEGRRRLLHSAAGGHSTRRLSER